MNLKFFPLSVTISLFFYLILHLSLQVGKPMHWLKAGEFIHSLRRESLLAVSLITRWSNWEQWNTLRAFRSFNKTDSLIDGVISSRSYLFPPKFDKAMCCITCLNAASLLALVPPESRVDRFLLSMHVFSSAVWMFFACCTRLCRWTGDVVFVCFFFLNGAVDQKYLGPCASMRLCTCFQPQSCLSLWVKKDTFPLFDNVLFSLFLIWSAT